MQTIRIGNLRGVANAQTASLDLPVGPTYRSLMLQCDGVAAEAIGRIKVVANAKVIQEYQSGKTLDRINAYLGLEPSIIYEKAATADDGVLTVSFDLVGRKARIGNEVTSLVTGGNNRPAGYVGALITSLAIEVDIIKATTGSVTVYGNIADATPSAHTGLINRWYTRPAITFTGAGIHNIYDMPKGEAWCLFLFDSQLTASPTALNRNGCNIKSVELSVGNRIIRNRSYWVNNAVIENFATRYMGLVEATDNDDDIRTNNWFPVDFQEAGYVNEYLAVGPSLQTKFALDIAETDTFPVHFQTMGTLNEGNI